MPITEPVAPAHPAHPICVPKAGAVKDPNQLGFGAAGSSGAGVTIAAKRVGFGQINSTDALTLKPQSAYPMMGVAGAEGGGTGQTADAGVSTVFPSQFAFGTAAGNKYRREGGAKTF